MRYAQMYPVANHDYQLIFRSASGTSGPEHAVFFYEMSGSAGPVLLDGGFPPGGPNDYHHRDGLFSAMSSKHALYFNHLHDSLGMFGRAALVHPLVGSAITLPSLPQSPGRMKQVSIWTNFSGAASAAWAEYRLGRWTVVALPDVAGADHIEFHSLADGLEPSIGGSKGGEVYLAWTEVRPELGVLAGKYQVVIANLNDPNTRIKIPNARHPSFAKNEWTGNVEFVFEKYDNNGVPLVGYVNLDSGIANPKYGSVKVKCDFPRRPVATYTDGLMILYTCNHPDDPAGTELHLHHRESGCYKPLDTLGHAPMAHEQAQYDVAGYTIVYSKLVGPRNDDFDLFVDETRNYCP